MNSKNHESAITTENAVAILNHLYADILIAITTLKNSEIRGFDTELHRQVTHRLCFTSLVMSCSKYSDLCKDYGKLLKTEIPQFNKVRNSFKAQIDDQRKIKSFRNDYIGHIHSKTLGRPLTPIEIQERFKAMWDTDDILNALDWICPDNLDSTDKTQSLAGVIGLMRDALLSKSDAE